MKKIYVKTTTLFLIMILIVGCAKIHVYTSDGIKNFEKSIKSEYPNISKVQVKRVGIVIRITYLLSNSVSDKEVKNLFKTTEEYVNKETFVKAISEEDKADRKSFSRAEMVVIIPDIDKKKGTHEKRYGLKVNE